ncbi:Imm52 family immunity protein [uncultured Methylovirgula sp.]|uniref:Imm52 family immunity protein n=1 Tax=uncultured Methylovirgula sp. TaxID=1285960 RepID=UPI002609E6AF|nr:Imm52 family immunity protein [uncultured Methylovirgula sp.]
MTPPQPIPGLDYFISVFWAGRAETPEELAMRWLKLIARFQTIDPIFAHWYIWPDIRHPLPFDTDVATLAEKIAAKVATSDTGEPLPIDGYQFFTRNNMASKRGPRSFQIDMFAGSPINFPLNRISLRTDYGVAPDSDLTTFRIFRSALLALAETFEATIGLAAPANITDLWPKDWDLRRKFPFAWITYVAPRFASLITPPASAVVERRPDGGLLMAATEETFDTANPQHVAAARQIEAAGAPFSALPYPWSR